MQLNEQCALTDDISQAFELVDKSAVIRYQHEGYLLFISLN